MDDLDFRMRPGRIGDRGPRSRSFVGQALRAAMRASAPSRRLELRATSGAGRGRSAALDASLRAAGRRVVVKARIVRHAGARFRSAPLAVHIGYLKRDGVDRAGASARMFDARGEADDRAFAARCAGDRHHFRFIVSPEDAAELADLRAFARDLMARAETDLGTPLDWMAVDHWNTAHPHVHVLVRGVDVAGRDLVIARPYIAQGLRAQAERLVTLELGPKTAREIAASLEREVGAERWTGLDAALAARSREGVVDLRRDPSGRDLQPALLGRARALERLGLAEPLGPARWRLAAELRPRLEALEGRREILRRLEAVAGPDRPRADLVLDGERLAASVTGRLEARGLHDELRGEAYVIVDDIEGRLRHVRLPDLASTGDTPVGGLVELRLGPDGLRLVHRSDLGLAAQIQAEGATWLDRRLVTSGAPPLTAYGFGADVRAALRRRTERLLEEGLAGGSVARPRFAAGLLARLRARELASAGVRLQAETGRPFLPGPAPEVRGRYVRRLDLASGRFAMVEDGLGFRLAPWAQALDRSLGQDVRGRWSEGRIVWDLGRDRRLSR